MRRQTVTIQFIQNGIIVFNKHQLQKYPLSSVENYKVINKQLFCEEFNKIIEENKINNRILTDNINIIIDDTFKEIDKENLKTILKELSFNKILFINGINIFHLDDNELLINISENNIKFYYYSKILNKNIYFKKYKQILNTYIKEILKKYNIKIIKIYGDYKDINNIAKYIEKVLFKEVYTYSYSELMPIKLLTYL